MKVGVELLVETLALDGLLHLSSLEVSAKAINIPRSSCHNPEHIGNHCIRHTHAARNWFDDIPGESEVGSVLSEEELSHNNARE